jgi:hypothetical protein
VSEDDEARAEAAVKIAVIVALAVIVVCAIAALTIVAVLTERDLFRAELLTFFTVAMLSAVGGVTMYQALRRHRWRLHVERNGDDEPDRRR